MASWQAFAMRTILRFTMKRAGRNGIDVDKTRASLGAPRPEVLKFWPGWNVGPRVVEGLTFETYDRADGPTLRDDLVVLYLHGGGYFFGSPQTHRQLASIWPSTAMRRCSRWTTALRPSTASRLPLMTPSPPTNG